MFLADMDALADISSRVDNLLQVGRVCETDEGKNRSLVRVDLGEGLVSDLVPLLQTATDLCSVYVAPRVGEQVLLLSPGGARGKGVAIRGIFHKDRKEPESKSVSNAVIEFNDKTKIIYDPKAHKLDIDLSGSKGTITIKGKEVTVKADEVTVDSDKISLGKGAFAGVVTGECKCVMTGAPHIEFSGKVKALK